MNQIRKENIIKTYLYTDHLKDSQLPKDGRGIEEVCKPFTNISSFAFSISMYIVCIIIIFPLKLGSFYILNNSQKIC